MIDSERKKDCAAVAFLFLLVVLYFWPILFGDKTLFFRDISGLLYPHYHLLHQFLHEGHFPFWNPFVFNGAPFLSALCPGVLYPPELVFLMDDFTSAYNLFNVGHYALFTVSVFALSRHLGMSAGAALCSAATAFLGGFFLSAIYFFLQIVWMPAVFLCFRKYAIDGKTGYLPATAVGIVFQLLCGPPESCIMTLALVFLHSVLLDNKGRALSLVLRLGGAVTIAVGLAAPQLLSTMALVPETIRNEGLSFEHHSHWSLEPGVLPTLILPKDFTGFMERIPSDTFGFFQNFHMGVFAVFFLCVSPLFFRRREIRFWFAVFVAGLFFALGKYNPAYEWVYNGLPFLKLFRYPEKFYIFCAFAQILLTGFVVDEFLQKPLRSVTFFAVLGVLCSAILYAAYWVPGSKPLASLAGLMAWGIFGYWFFSGRMTGAVLKTGLLFLIVFDLTLKHYMLVPMIDREFFEAEPAAVKLIKQDKGIFRVFSGGLETDLNRMTLSPDWESFLLRQIVSRERLLPSRGVTYGIASPYGSAGMGMELKDVRLWGEVFEKSPPDRRARMLQRGNVKYLVTGDETAMAGRVQTLDDVLPRAFLVPKARQGEDLKLLNTYYDPAFDPRQEVLLSEPVVVKESADFAGQVDAIHYEANRVVIKSHQTGDGFLVLLDTWFPGWTATVDGRPEHIYRANHFYRAVKTGPGPHTVEFSFMPPGFKWGTWICIATLTLMIIGVPVISRRRTPG